MRISDWSSDVCSSDLTGHSAARPLGHHPLIPDDSPSTPAWSHLREGDGQPCSTVHGGTCQHYAGVRTHDDAYSAMICLSPRPSGCRYSGCRITIAVTLSSWLRSEEHTSELQSLMRISYAVLCLK